MARKIPQKPNSAKASRQAAAAANNVPELRAAVEALAAYNEQVERRLEKQEIRRGRGQG